MKDQNDYYYKYKKYKRKYIVEKNIFLKGGNEMKDCNGDALPRGGIYSSEISVNDIFKHYGNCVDRYDFSNFIGLCRDNNIQIIDLIKVGFSYEQILKSGIDSQKNINAIVWTNKDIVDNKFLSEAIKKGYISLLSSKNKSNKEVPMIQFDNIIKIFEDIFLDTSLSSDYIYNLAKNLIIKIKKFDSDEVKDLDFKMKKIWEILKKNDISQTDIFVNN
jgi:hypothetical protein